MKRRILAWALLAGFVLLILNLIVFRFYWQLSMVVYLIIMFAFLLTNGKFITTDTAKRPYTADEGVSGDGEDDDQNDLMQNKEESGGNIDGTDGTNGKDGTDSTDGSDSKL